MTPIALQFNLKRTNSKGRLESEAIVELKALFTSAFRIRVQTGTIYDF
jgi:hypothetical protein